MTDGTGMIYLGMSPWDSMWKNRHHLMSRFSAIMPVLYVEPWQFLRKVRRSLLSGRSGFRQLNWSTVSHRADNLFVFQSPAQFPVSGSKALGPITKWHWYSAVKRSAKRVGISNPILWISRPEMHAAVGAFDECLSIYHIVDEYAGYTRQGPASDEEFRRHEQKLLDAADLSIVVSPELFTSKSAPDREVHLVENGVDIVPYDDLRTFPRVPDDIGKIKKPILGYCGLIAKRLDLDLLLELAGSKQDWSLVLIGKVDDRGCSAKINALRKLANVHLLGEKPYHAVPSYISCFDLGLLPYCINLETKNISPLKMYEYFAAGLPVVSTRIPAAERAVDMVSIGHDAADFIRNCGSLLDTDSAEARRKRIEYARTNTWEARVDQIRGILSDKLSRLGSVGMTLKRSN